jgi:DNA modification methylase
MAKIEITKTELVWPGKYNEDGTLREVPRVSLPFQVIETVNESRATREAKKSAVQGTLFDVWEGKEGDTFEEGWRNKLIWGDNLLVMGSLLEKFAGKIDLIYIDPPFATGADFSFTTEIGESGEEVTKEQSVIEEKAYRDTWGQGTSSYLSMMHKRLILMRDLLSEGGSIYVHCDWRVDNLMRSLMDEVFGIDNLRNEVIWHYEKWTSPSGVSFQKNHDVVLFYAKNKKNYFEEIRHVTANLEEKYKKGYLLGGGGGSRGLVVYDPENPKVKELIASGKYDVVYASKEGKPLSDVWQIPFINPVASERINYPTQKPEALLERIVRASSKNGDLVADFFCGSGTTLAVAEKLGRRWIGCDLGRWAIHVTRKRLLSIPNCKPFEVLNLGKYERQYWQGVTFLPAPQSEAARQAGGDKRDKSVTERALYEYLAFILKLYGAQPVAGMAHLHGKKGKAMVHVGAVDAPVTIDEVNQALDECAKLKQTELHVLGWEWEMGLAGPNNDVRKGSPMHEIARQKGVKLLLLQIPREVMEQQAAEKGDVRFFELAYFEAKISKPEKWTVQVELKDFATPNADLIPEDVRSKIKKWSDYIDYWAIDWDFQNDTFMQGWVAYRTRKERKLPLVSDPHTYEKPGKYRILVKVIDIFGNDTSQAFDVEVK